MSFDPIRLKKLWDNLKASEGKDNEDAHFNKWQMAWNDAFPAIVSEIETLRKWNEGNKILSESYRKKNDELTILSREAEAGKRLAEELDGFMLIRSSRKAERNSDFDEFVHWRKEALKSYQESVK